MCIRDRRKEYYFGTDRDGNNLIYNDVCAEARIVSVIRAGIFVEDVYKRQVSDWQGGDISKLFPALSGKEDLSMGEDKKADKKRKRCLLYTSNAVMVDRLKAALPLLSDSEQELIQAIFFDGL